MSCPRAAPGPFYTVEESCLFCRAPHEEAPQLLDMDEGQNCSIHCFFRRQPETPEDVDRALRAMAASATGDGIPACCGE